MKKNINLLIGFVVLSGIAVIGAVWFKKNKPNNANLQANELINQLNSIVGGGAEDIDKPFNFQNVAPSPGLNLQYNSPVVIGNFTPSEIAAIKTVTNNIPDIQQGISNQISQGLQNVDFSQLSNLGLSNLNFSNIKIK
jgi:hypothetical protein